MDYLLPEPVNIGNDEYGIDLHPDEISQVREFYKDRCVLMTGATGFLGKLILEKLLRTCTHLKRIYIIIRLKGFFNMQVRKNDLFELPIFEQVKREQPNVFQKVVLIRGDCMLKNLGLSVDDMAMLTSEVDCIFHCASTTMYDDNLKMATYVNVRALRDLIALAKSMKKLKAFIHVSSIYVNCFKAVIEETFGKPFVSGNVLIDFLDSLDGNMRNTSPISYKDWPNDFVFTKSIAEEVIRSQAGSLPIAIVRPAIVISTAKDPLPGWTDNVNSPTGLVMTTLLGLTRSILANVRCKADLVPADYAVNAIIVAAWDIAQSKSFNANQQILLEKHDEVPIYNITSSAHHSITWGQFFELAEEYGNKIPSVFMLKTPWHFVVESKKVYVFLVNILHYFPTYIEDFLAFKFPIKSRYIEYYRKIDTLSDTLCFFTLNTWEIKNYNTRKLIRKLKPIDKELFDFDLRELNWNLYFYQYVRGIRVHILKDELSTVPQASWQYQKLKALHYLVVLFIFFLIYLCVYYFVI